MKGSDRDSDVLLDFPLAGEVQHVAGFFAAGDGRLQEMLYTGGGCGIGQALALLDLAVITHTLFPEILHGEDAITVLASQLQGNAVVEITGHHFHAPVVERTGGGLVRVAGERANGKTLLQQQGNERATLGAGGTGDENAFVGHKGSCSELVGSEQDSVSVPDNNDENRQQVDESRRQRPITHEGPFGPSISSLCRGACQSSNSSRA